MIATIYDDDDYYYGRWVMRYFANENGGTGG